MTLKQVKKLIERIASTPRSVIDDRQPFFVENRKVVTRNEHFFVQERKMSQKTH